MSTVVSSKKVDVKSNIDRLRIRHFLVAVINSTAVIEEWLAIFF
jgi:hypothetical protein